MTHYIAFRAPGALLYQTVAVHPLGASSTMAAHCRLLELADSGIITSVLGNILLLETQRRPIWLLMAFFNSTLPTKKTGESIDNE